jgi:hypothetical protein
MDKNISATNTSRPYTYVEPESAINTLEMEIETLRHQLEVYQAWVDLLIKKFPTKE